MYLEFTHNNETDYQVVRPNIIVEDKTSSAPMLKSEMSNTTAQYPRDMARGIMRFRRNAKHCLEGVETEFYLTSSNSRDKVVYMHEMRDITSVQNETNLRGLIANVQHDYDVNHARKNFSVIVVEGSVKAIMRSLTNSHASTLIVEHKDPKRLFLFDTSENIHQDPNRTTGAVSASAEIFGNLTGNVKCLNTTGQALQDNSSCTYWATCFADTLQNCNSIDDIVKGQQGQEFLNPDVLDETIGRLCEIDSSMVVGLNDPPTKTFAPDSPAGNLLQSLQAEMARQSVAAFATNQQQRQQQGTLFAHRNNPHARHPITPNYRGFF